MLKIAQQQAEASGVATHISFHHADVGQLATLFADDSFDVGVCHNLLEYVEEPARTVRDMARVLRDNAVVSMLVRNRAAEVLRAAIKMGDCALARGNLLAEIVVASLLGNRSVCSLRRRFTL